MNNQVMERTTEDILEQCRRNGMDLGRSVLDLMRSGMISNRPIPFMTEVSEAHRSQHEGFLSVVGVDGIKDEQRPDVVKVVGNSCLVREVQIGVQIGGDGKLTEFPQGWNYYIRPAGSPGSDT